MDTTSTTGEIPVLQQRPPLEIVEQGRIWLVKAYQRGEAEGEVFSTHDTQMDAVRATKTKMEADNHPCSLRWDTPQSVGNLYWNPLFEYLEVRYDELLETWTIVPADGTCALASYQSQEQAYKQATQVQHDYDFKHLRAYDRTGNESDERDHRFLRHDITSSGVRFYPSALDGPAETSIDESSIDKPSVDEDDEDEISYLGPASPSQLGASIPDVTRVTFVDTDGVLHRYATPWGDGTNAEVIAVSRKYTDNEEIRDAFDQWLSRWEAVDDHSTVATVHESDLEPVPWVAYQAGEYTLEDVGIDLPVDRRIAALDQIRTAIEAFAAISDEPVCAVPPEWIHVHTTGKNERVAVSQWGIEWEIQQTLDAFTPTPFTAPEQLDGRLTETTAVYHLGAIAYYLLCEWVPVQDNIAAAIKAGDIPPARPIGEVPNEAGAVIDRALSLTPTDRHDSVKAFCHALRDTM